MRRSHLSVFCAVLLAACLVGVCAVGMVGARLVRTPFAFAGDARDAREVRLRAFASEYVAATTPAARRTVLADELLRDDAGVVRSGEVPAVVRVVRDALQADARRAAALDLAVILRCGGAFGAAKRFADGPLGDRVAALAAVCGDEDAATWLLARWRMADPASDAFRYAEAALTGHVLSPASVDALGAVLRDDVRGASAFAILRPQMGLNGDATWKGLAEDWSRLRAEHAVEARAFVDPGAIPLLAPRPRDGDAWRLHGAVPVGGNLRVPAGRCLDLTALPSVVRRDDGALRVRVRAGDASGAQFSLDCDGGIQSLTVRCDGKVWYLIEGPPRAGDRVEAPCAPGEWTEFVVRVRDPQIDGQPLLRDVRVWCGGVEMRPGGGFWRLREPFASLTVRAPDAAPCLVGGVTWTSCAR